MTETLAKQSVRSPIAQLQEALDLFPPKREERVLELLRNGELEVIAREAAAVQARNAYLQKELGDLQKKAEHHYTERQRLHRNAIL